MDRTIRDCTSDCTIVYTKSSVRDAGCGMRDAGCGMRDAGC